MCVCVQWLKWSCEAEGLIWRSHVGANPVPIPHPTNLALLGHKITLYRCNQGAHTIAGGSNRSRGLTPWPPHCNHWVCAWCYTGICVPEWQECFGTPQRRRLRKHNLHSQMLSTLSSSVWYLGAVRAQLAPALIENRCALPPTLLRRRLPVDLLSERRPWIVTVRVVPKTAPQSTYQLRPLRCYRHSLIIFNRSRMSEYVLCRLAMVSDWYARIYCLKDYCTWKC